MSDVRTVVYELALRGLEQQERELADLRARTNTVVAAAALTASFLGAVAIRGHRGVTQWSVTALALRHVEPARSVATRPSLHV